ATAEGDVDRGRLTRGQRAALDGDRGEEQALAVDRAVHAEHARADDLAVNRLVGLQHHLLQGEGLDLGVSGDAEGGQQQGRESEAVESAHGRGEAVPAGRGFEVGLGGWGNGWPNGGAIDSIRVRSAGRSGCSIPAEDSSCRGSSGYPVNGSRIRAPWTWKALRFRQAGADRASAGQGASALRGWLSGSAHGTSVIDWSLLLE